MTVGLATRGYICPILRVWEGRVAEVDVTVEPAELAIEVTVEPTDLEIEVELE